MKRNGEITAVDAEVVQRGGAYGGYGLVTILYAGALLHALYRVGAVEVRGYRVYTNTPPCGAMRGHGAVDARHAFESLLDTMAAELGARPVRGAPRQPDRARRTARSTTCRSTPTACPQCLDWVEQASGWRERRGKLPRAGRGLGMACSHYVSGSAKPVHWSGEPHAVINLKLDFDGGITILTGASDIGQGSSTLLAQVVAEVLLLPMARIRVIATDSALTPKDNGSYSSRVSFMVGNAALRAARGAEARAGRRPRRGGWRSPPRTSNGEGERCRVAGTDRGLDFAEVVTGGAGRHRHAHGQGHVVDAARNAGRQVPRRRRRLDRRLLVRGAGGRGQVDEETGVVRVERSGSAHDCGFAINPLAVEGQVQGAVWMGMGQALCEETQYHEGLPLRANMLDYRIPTIVESPPIEVQLVESHRPARPVRRQGGERRRLHSFPPALTNAIADAIGMRLNALPVTPDRVLEAMQERRRASERRQASAGAAARAPARRLTWKRCPNSSCSARRRVAEAAALARGRTGRAPARRRHRPAAEPAARPRAPGVLVDLGGVRRLRRASAATDGRLALGAGVTLAALARRSPRIARGYAGARRGRAHGRRPRSPQRGDGGRQPVPRHALRVLQPERVVARGERLLPEARRRHLPRRAAGQALPCGVRGDLAPALLALAPRSRSSAGRGARRMPLADLYRDDGAAHLTLAPDEVLARVHVPAPRRGQRIAAIARCACAARSISRWPAWRARSRFAATRSPTLRVALTGTNSRPLVLAGHRRVRSGGRSTSRARRAAASWCRSRSARCEPPSPPSNYRRQVAAVLAQRLVRELGTR